MKSMMFHRLALTSIMASSSLLTACGPNYYLVTSDFVVADIRETPPEIVESQTYLSVIPGIKVLVVKAPEGCADETATQSSGEAAGQRVLLKTTCGIEMAELERALTKAGFRVVSWKVLQNKVTKEELTPNLASKKLGAQVLFQINSLERSLIHAGADARWERRFYESNREGEKFKPAFLPTHQSNQLVSQVKNKEASFFQTERLSVTINASASLVERGETMWFYEWTHAEAKGGDRQLASLAACEKGICRVASGKGKDRTDEEALVSGSSEAISRQQNPKDLATAMYHKLLRELVTNLATAFKEQS